MARAKGWPELDWPAGNGHLAVALGQHRLRHHTRAQHLNLVHQPGHDMPLARHQRDHHPANQARAGGRGNGIHFADRHVGFVQHLADQAVDGLRLMFFVRRAVIVK